MMRHVVPAVQQLMPGFLKQLRPSVACVCTTRPKYLVFDGESNWPACVVEFGEQAQLHRVSRLLSQLGARLPRGLIPASLCCARWDDTTFVHVQEGLRGAPWFRVADGISDQKGWRVLIDRALDVMLRLHAVTMTLPEFTGVIQPAEELTKQLAVCESNGVRFGASVREYICASAAVMDQRRVQGFAQHGDFSLNNLLIAEPDISIIDFEEFGSTMVPLHDAFGLALSMALSQNGRCTLSRAECFERCVAPSIADGTIDRQHLPALLLHHLLLRINHAHGVPRRLPLQRILLGWVDELAASTFGIAT